MGKGYVTLTSWQLGLIIFIHSFLLSTFSLLSFILLCPPISLYYLSPIAWCSCLSSWEMKPFQLFHHIFVQDPGAANFPNVCQSNKHSNRNILKAAIIYLRCWKKNFWNWCLFLISISKLNPITLLGPHHVVSVCMCISVCILWNYPTREIFRNNIISTKESSRDWFWVSVTDLRNGKNANILDNSNH